jgi:peptide/nickel transport system permease protein
MESEILVGNGITEVTPHINETRRVLRVLIGRKIVIFGFVIIFLTLVAAIFAPLIAPYDPYQPNMDATLARPGWQHWLGTDTMGRDTLSRIIFGARTSLIVGIGAVGIAAVLGITLGLSAGFFGGIVNTVIMRFVDALMAFPMILLALVIAALLGGGLTNIVIAVGISMMAAYARLVCGQVLSIKENDYILAEKALGSNSLRILARHVFPNCLAPLIVMMTMMLGGAILAEAGLSFLGIGINPPGAAWGAMVNSGYRYLLSDPVLSFAPGLAIMLVVFSFNMLGDGLRDALDPRLRGTL